jgi:hypothetical protein
MFQPMAVDEEGIAINTMQMIQNGKLIHPLCPYRFPTDDNHCFLVLVYFMCLFVQFPAFDKAISNILQSVSADIISQRMKTEKKVVVFMCGLPARGKSFISKKLTRYLRYMPPSSPPPRDHWLE